MLFFIMLEHWTISTLIATNRIVRHRHWCFKYSDLFLCLL